MKTATARQFANAAFASEQGPKTWEVSGMWKRNEPMRVLFSGLTYREASAHARAIRDACGYACVQRMK